MGFEFVYAYLENLAWFITFGVMLSTAALLVLIWARVTNEIDKDDWSYLMTVGVSVWVVFLFLVLAPGMDHIKEVREKVIAKQVKATTVSFCPFNTKTPSEFIFQTPMH